MIYIEIVDVPWLWNQSRYLCETWYKCRPWLDDVQMERYTHIKHYLMVYRKQEPLPLMFFVGIMSLCNISLETCLLFKLQILPDNFYKSKYKVMQMMYIV